MRTSSGKAAAWPAVLLSTLLSSICFSTPAAADKSAADYYVHSLPGAPEPLLNMYAGHVEITPEHHGNMFFWFYKNRHIANRGRTVIWLNGGPGCSSMDGAMMEIGPYRVKKDGTLKLNDGSWDEFANLLFIDNPVGTGFSYVDTDSYIHDLDEMAAQMTTFLEKWFAIFPEHAHDDVRYRSFDTIHGSTNNPCRSTLLANRTLDNTSLTSQRQCWTATRGRITTNGTSAAF